MLSADLQNLRADVAAVAQGAAMMFTRTDCDHLARVLEECARQARTLEMGVVPDAKRNPGPDPAENITVSGTAAGRGGAS